MRTNIDIDDKLMEQAMQSTGATTKKAVVEEALRMLVRTRSQAAIRDLFGTVEWEGDLKRSRQGRFPK
jgi:Arc/MetJ family transcription regulator